MNRIVTLFLLAAGSVVAVDRPNILLFLVDDMGVMDTSVPFVYTEDEQPILTELNERYRTPNMERLAAQGMRFTNAYAYSVCTPTRATLITGEAAPRHHITTWTDPHSQKADTGKVKTDRLRGPAWRTEGVNPERPLLPELLRDAGYRTLFAGKAHFGPNDTPVGNPLNVGFDVNIAGHGAGGPATYYGEKNYGGESRWAVPGLEKYHGTETFLTEAITLEMMDVMSQAVEDDTHFFAYMSHYAVHAPFNVDSRFAGNYAELSGKDLGFATLVEGMDKSLGDLMDKLEALGVAEETLIVFISDNGSDGPFNKPLRGKKGTRFEGGLRVPLMVAWAKPNPQHPLQRRLAIEANSIETAIVTCEDIMPTVLQWGGVKLPEGVELDGHNLTPYLIGKAGTHRPQRFVAHFPHGRHNNNLFSTLREGDWKIIYNYQPKTWELYDLNNDLSESKNLIGSKPEVAAEMAQKLVAELERMDAQFPINHHTGKAEKPDLSRWQMSAAKPLRMQLKPYSDENHFKTDGYFNWGGSILQGEDGKYYLFYSRWPQSHGFLAWLTHSEVAIAVSESPSGPWKYHSTALKGKRDGSWNSAMAHNPKIKKFGDTYYLYYISTPTELSDEELRATAKGGYRHPNWGPLRSEQRIGVATSKSLLGPWETQDKPLVQPKEPVFTLTVNPAVTQMPDSRFLMILKGDKKPVRSQRVQAVAISDYPDHGFEIQPELAIKDFDTEDVSIWYDSAREKYFATYHAHSHYGVIESIDGFSWTHTVDFPKALRHENGSVYKVRRMERPFVYQSEKGERVFLTSCWDGKTSSIFTVPMVD